MKGLFEKEPPVPSEDAYSTIAKGMIQQTQFVKEKAPYHPELPFERGDRSTVPSSAYEKANSFLDMMVGPELAIMGVKWDGHGWNASLDNIKDQWANEPLWTNLLHVLGLVSTIALPMAATASAYKYGEAGAKSMGQGGEGVRFGRTATTHGFQVQDTAGVFGEAGASIRWFDQFRSAAEEQGFLKRIGALDPNSLGVPEELKNARIIAHRKLQGVDQYLRAGQRDIYAAEVAASTKLLAYQKDIRNPDPKQLAQLTEEAKDLVAKKGIVDAQFTPLEEAKMWFDKQFANEFFNKNNDVTPEGQLRSFFSENIKRRYDPESKLRWTALEESMLDATDFQKKFYQRAIERTAPSLGENVVFNKRYNPTPEEAHVIDTILDYAESNQSHAIDTGMWSKEQGNIHINALRRGGLVNRVDRLDSGSNFKDKTFTPSLLKRESSMQEVWDAVEAGKIQPDTVKKIINSYLMDDFLHFNYQTIRDLLIHDKFVFNPLRDPGLGVEPDAVLRPPGMPSKTPTPGLVEYQIYKYDDAIKYAGGYEFIPKHMVDLNKLYEGNEAGRRRLISMMENPKYGNANMITTLENGDKRLPFVPRFIAKALGDLEDGIQAVRHASIHSWDILTMMYKGAKAPLNPATHAQNILGNIVFMSMAGMNPFSPKNLDLLKQSTNAFKEVHAAHDAVIKAAKERGRLDVQSPYATAKEVYEELSRSKTFLEYTRDDGTVFRTHISELGEKIVQQLYEEGAFDAIEGAAAIGRAGARYGTANAKMIAKGFTKVQGVFRKAGTSEQHSLGALFDGMSKWYLGEDVIPKIALYLKNRAGGLSINAAVSEVARRMPMYASVGTRIKQMRKTVFPWMSFPTEALRIMKNNMIDNPLKVLPWLYATRATQGLYSALGIADTSRDAIQEAKQQLPVWAQTPATVMTEGKGILPHMAPGVAQGGLLGGIMGGAFGGPMGALMGGAAGVAAGAMPAAWPAIAENIFGQKQKEGAMIRGAVLNWLPYTSFFLQSDSPQYSPFAENIDGMTAFKRALDLSPAEPFAIMKPIMDTLMGIGPFGEEIQSAGPLDFASKMIAGLIGFVMPPLVQKYFFKTTTPDVSASSIITSNRIVNDADPTNISRALVDLGVANDAMTGIPGNPLLDIALNGFGVLKSYPAVAERYYANLELNNVSMENVRNFHSRNLRFYLENNQDELATDVLRRVFMTFQQENIDNPGVAMDKYADWIKKRWSTIGKSPQFAGMSQDELEFRFNEAAKFAKEAVNTARQTRMDALKHERLVRKTIEERRHSLGKDYADQGGLF